jgi:hypothetical protein
MSGGGRELISFEHFNRGFDFGANATILFAAKDP